jgi:hypothetical protein
MHSEHCTRKDLAPGERYHSPLSESEDVSQDNLISHIFLNTEKYATIRSDGTMEKENKARVFAILVTRVIPGK